MYDESNTLGKELEAELAMRIDYLQLCITLEIQHLAQIFNIAVLQLRHDQFVVDMKMKSKELK